MTEVLQLFLAPENFLAIAIGVVIGVIVGSIPGLTATMAVALALPFTFSMEPVAAILLLVGIYKGGMYGGSITAILIRTPGSPASACTLLDGYPMAQNGEAKKALKMALYASVIADFISNIALIFFAAYLAKIALNFGAPEFFWLICFSLTIIISLASGSMVKGLLAALLGILLSLVGLDSVFGSQRLTFGNYNLMDSISFIPLLIGLFAIPEIIEFYRKGGAAFACQGEWGRRYPERDEAQPQKHRQGQPDRGHHRGYSWYRCHGCGVHLLQRCQAPLTQCRPFR